MNIINLSLNTFLNDFRWRGWRWCSGSFESESWGILVLIFKQSCYPITGSSYYTYFKIILNILIFGSPLCPAVWPHIVIKRFLTRNNWRGEPSQNSFRVRVRLYFKDMGKFCDTSMSRSQIWEWSDDGCRKLQTMVHEVFTIKDLLWPNRTYLMDFTSVYQFHIYLPCFGACLA